MSGGKHFELEGATDAISAVRFATDSSTKLLVSSWDKNIYLYDISKDVESQFVRKFEYPAAVLDVSFGKDSNEAYSGGMDRDVRRTDLTTGEQTVLSSHEEPVKCVLYSPETDIVISASWDSTLHVHLRSKPEHPHATIRLQAKAFTASLTATRLVIAMAERHVSIYELQTLKDLASETTESPPSGLDVTPWQQRESSLKFQTRAVACMPNDAGFACSSIEGRVAVEWFDPSAESQARKYAFKCHRVTQEDGDMVYPVHALAFNAVHGTFASGGGDGVVALWDAVAKRRIRQYQKYNNSVTALSFSGDGKYLAIGTSYPFEGETFEQDGSSKVYIRELSSTEAAGKKAKA